MNSKQLKLLVIIFVCIGVVGYLLVTQNNKSWSQGEQAIGGKVMPDIPMNDVTQTGRIMRRIFRKSENCCLLSGNVKFFARCRLVKVNWDDLNC